MIGIREAKAAYFDRDAVLKRVDKATLRVLSRFGAFTRQRAISLILRHVVRRGFGVKSKTRNREGVSPPGQPPYSHTGDLAKLIGFVFDASRRSVLVGPEKFNKPGGDGRALAVLEAGGDETLPAWKQRAARLAHYRARPFMKPAFDAELEKMPPNWRDSLQG